MFVFNVASKQLIQLPLTWRFTGLASAEILCGVNGLFLFTSVQPHYSIWSAWCWSPGAGPLMLVPWCWSPGASPLVERRLCWCLILLSHLLDPLFTYILYDWCIRFSVDAVCKLWFCCSGSGHVIIYSCLSVLERDPVFPPLARGSEDESRPRDVVLDCIYITD